MREVPVAGAGSIAPNEIADFQRQLKDQRTLGDVLSWLRAQGLGAVTAVAVWDHRPTHDELLNARLSSGWKPTPSKLKSGDKVLGYAACAVSSLPHRHSDA